MSEKGWTSFEKRWKPTKKLRAGSIQLRRTRRDPWICFASNGKFRDKNLTKIASKLLKWNSCFVELKCLMRNRHRNKKKKFFYSQLKARQIQNRRPEAENISLVFIAAGKWNVKRNKKKKIKKLLVSFVASAEEGARFSKNSHPFSAGDAARRDAERRCERRWAAARAPQSASDKRESILFRSLYFVLVVSALSKRGAAVFSHSPSDNIRFRDRTRSLPAKRFRQTSFQWSRVKGVWEVD